MIKKRGESMKEKDFDIEKLLKLKELADKIKAIPDADFDEALEDEFDEAFEESGFAELFGQLLSKSLSEPAEPVTEEEIYEEIVDNFFILIKELGVENFSFFRFADYEYCREIIIDGKKYDLDGEFYHDDETATGALCAVDCLVGDIEDDYQTVLKNVEKMINIRNRK